jgi:hypothetical protein
MVVLLFAFLSLSSAHPTNPNDEDTNASGVLASLPKDSTPRGEGIVQVSQPLESELDGFKFGFNLPLSLNFENVAEHDTSNHDLNKAVETNMKVPSERGF